MNNQTILILVIALLIGGIGGYIIGNEDKKPGLEEQKNRMTDDVPSGMHRMPDGTLMGNADGSMGGMSQMDHMLAMMVESEREFLEGMIPHHQEAVDTAKEVIERGGTTPEVKKLVENIVITQEKEIALMKELYDAWYGDEYADNGEYMPMMRELENLSGTEIDRVFLEDMIGHHMGAVIMARSVQPYIEHSEMAELADTIIVTQTAEIAAMRRMLQGL